MEKIIQKVCKKHGLTDYIYVKSSNKYRCKKCLQDAVTEQRKRNKKKLVEYKGGKCEICGYDKCIDSLEFHHLNPEEKSFGISNGNIKSFKRLKEEADKCILVCSNCHNEIHYREKMEKLNKQKQEEEYNQKNYVRNCQNNNFTPPINNKKEFNLEIIKEQLKKYKQKDIAKLNNCSLSTLKRFLKENNLTNDKEKHKMKYMTIDNFVKLFKENNYKKTEVARIIGVKTLALNEYCYRNGIPWRKKEMIEYMENY